MLTTISSISSICIVVFPCNNAVFDECGLFMIPVNVSSVVHNIFAAVLFTSFAAMILTQFTKGQNTRRNKIYYACGTIIVLAMVSQIVTSILNISWMTIVNEFFMLEAFAVAWIVKSKAHIVKSKLPHTAMTANEK